MEWSNSLVEGATILNQDAVRIYGSDATILSHYWRAQPDHYNNRPHQHSFFELCYIVEGEGTYIDGKNSYPITNHCLFLSRPFVKHQILSESGLKIIYVGFELIKKDSTKNIVELFVQLEKTNRYFIEHADQSPLIHLWSSLLCLAKHSEQMFNNSFQGLCAAFYTTVIDLFSDRPSTPQRNMNQRLYSSLVYQAKLYIHNNLSQSLHIDDVANYIHISSRHLSRIFQSELGQTFTNYVKKERMRKASDLLSNTDLSLKEISERLGFKNVHYFTTVFSKEMGMPPGEFKRKLHQQTML